MMSAQLWAAEKRSRDERNRCKVLSKIDKFMIELGNHSAKDVVVSYKSFRVITRVNGKVVPRQVRSAPTPAGEPNVWAEAERRKIYTVYKIHQKMLKTVQLTSIFQTRRRNNYMEQKSRKRGKIESRRAAFLAFRVTVSQLPKPLCLQNIFNFVSKVCCGRPRGGYVGRGCHASVLLTQRSAGKFAM